MSGRGEVRLEPPIGDYAFLSDCASAALVDRTGSIDWWCVPRFDSPSVFGRLLGPSGGHWTLRPAEEFDSSREYIEDSLALRTVFRTSSGEVAVSDALALEPGARGHDIGLRSPHVLLRQVVGVSGVVEMHTEFAPRMEYGRTQPYLRVSAGGVQARGGPVQLECTAAIPWGRRGEGAAAAVFAVAAGQTVELRLTYRPSFAPLPTGTADTAGVAGSTGSVAGGDVPSLEDTCAGWRSWVQQHAGYDGAYPELVRRSSIVLQGLTYQRSGAVVAAATTSLPEQLGGQLNFDYRFAWLRDLSLTIRSLWIAACPDEPSRLFDWFSTAAGRNDGELVQIMYGVEGERDLTERALDHLTGYRNSRPVRVGNQAWTQKQLDVLGEVLDAAHLLRDSLGDLDAPVQDMLVTLADRAADSWSEPDAGMWEARDVERHYTSSKVMCWTALDRAVQLAPLLGDHADPVRWAAARDKVRAAVLTQAWSDKAGAYCGAFGSDDMDASVLLLPLVGFLPATDERMWATIRAVERELGAGGLIRRWKGDPGGFLLCTYWLVECLAMGGDVEGATVWFDRATSHGNDLGLLAEQADPSTGQLLGNFPQAFSHVGLVNAAWRLAHPSDLAHTQEPLLDRPSPRAATGAATSTAERPGRAPSQQGATR